MRRRGVTLLESIFSALLLAFVLIAVVELFPASTLALHRADAEIQAGALAYSALDKWRAAGWSRPTLSPGSFDDSGPDQPADVNEPDLSGRTRCGVYERDQDDDWTERRGNLDYHVVVSFSRVDARRVDVTARVNWSLKKQNHSLARTTSCVPTLSY